jgi:glycosyltransferase involved in cell wall biosynthesis
VVDTERFTPAPQDPDVFRIGWIGNPSTTPHLTEAGIAVGGPDQMEITLMGADAARVPWPGARVVPWSLEGEAAFLQGCTVGIMPLPKTDWARGKCALKALQFMACGIPCIATPWGAVRAIIRDGENGCLAERPEEWTAAIARLQDAAWRRRLGQAARSTVEERFALGNAVEQLARRLKHLA